MKHRFCLLALVTALSLSAHAQQSPAARPAAPRAPTAALGRITGTLSFPSDYIPADMKVVAEPVGGGRSYSDMRRNDRTYSLRLPAGRYYVYARTKENPGYRAYYNAFVTCGLNVECPSHAKLVVVVAASKTTPKIDPQDWYDTPAIRGAAQ